MLQNFELKNLKEVYFVDIFKKCNDFTLAEQYRKMGIYPYFHALESRQDVEVIMEGKRRIMLGPTTISAHNGTFGCRGGHSGL